MLDVRDVLPEPLALGVGESTFWFVIGGQAVRCFVPYRPSRDADFGVLKAKDLEALLTQLRGRGVVELLERAKDTAHLTFDGIDVSVFVLPRLAAHIDCQVLTATGILATKTHAILDRGSRRDFFDLYVMLQSQKLGVIACLSALNDVYETSANHGLVLRALSYFDDAEAEPPLPGEAQSDWVTVRTFFSRAVAALVVPPIRALGIQANVVDVRITDSKHAARRRAPVGRGKSKSTKARP